jgi:aspartyl-tRNA(Asn)/glutamyl-tRNA(Gln) amidotransferase subunit A
VNLDELAFAPVTELAPLLQQRKVSPVELTRLFLDRISTHDTSLRAYITVTTDEALAMARRAEQEIGQGIYLGPLHGIPIGVKDQFSTRGILTTAGSRLMAENVPDIDATVYGRLRGAGVVLLGKQNMTEFALGGTIDWPYGIARNPWNLSLSPGASSSGGGAATAAGLCTVSLGEDTGGSIRNPAAYCGLVGIKPTHGRVSRHGAVPLCWSTDCAGPIAHTAEDCAVVLGVIAGHDPRDRISSRRPVPDFRAGLNREIKGLQLGVVREAMEVARPEMQEAITTAARVLEGLGAIVEEVSIPLVTLTGAIYAAYCDVEGAALHQDRLRGAHLRLWDRATRVRLMTGSLVPFALYDRAARARDVLRAQVMGALQQVDVLVSPSAAGPAVRLEETQARWTSIDEVVDRRFRQAVFTSPYSLSGHPALSTPCSFSETGLPLGMQLIGRYFDEATILRVAHQYQSMTPWHRRRPSLTAT